ncbi:MAG TPA: lipoyl(octanoyl) transferase LipB [Candidatus Dormibacteraeota bacterium]|nr:lipoyl(octanoyl) transferase LipB [Candidatus Dormibacteraeota bacterium]
MSRSRPPVRSCWLGSVPYQRAWDLQRSLVEGVRSAASPDTVLFLEHPHVFTMGRKGLAEHVLWDERERARRRVDLIWSDRGGDATYHGPGQLVGYPILDLASHGLDLLDYLRSLEASLVAYLREFGIEGAAVPGLTGVWVGDAKVAAIGVKFNGGVVSHGFALNLTTDLNFFEGIVPCGITDKKATSVEALTGRRLGTEEAARAYAPHLASALGLELDWSAPLPEPATAGRMGVK